MICFFSERKRNAGVARIPMVVAIACFVAMVGCSDSMGPKPSEEPTVSGLAVLAAELHDAADVFAQGVASKDMRVRAELAVNCVAEQLLAGRVASSRAALADARALLANPDDISAIELVPVTLALDYIERRILQVVQQQ